METVKKKAAEMHPGDIFRCAYGDDENVGNWIFLQCAPNADGRWYTTLALSCEKSRTPVEMCSTNDIHDFVGHTDKCELVEEWKFLKSMHHIMQSLNDEEIYLQWLSLGIADGDDLDDFYTAAGYLDQKTLNGLTLLFEDCVAAARRSGGFWLGSLDCTRLGEEE